MIIAGIIMGGIVLIALIIAIASTVDTQRGRQLEVTKGRLAFEEARVKNMDAIRLKELDVEGRRIDFEGRRIDLERERMRRTPVAAS